LLLPSVPEGFFCFCVDELWGSIALETLLFFLALGRPVLVNVVAVTRLPEVREAWVAVCKRFVVDELCLVNTATATKAPAPRTIIAENILRMLPDVLYMEVFLGIVFSFPDTSLPFFLDFAIAGNKKY
jgi:hypothetical protein